MRFRIGQAQRQLGQLLELSGLSQDEGAAGAIGIGIVWAASCT
jgi:hypothetical protein